MVEQYTTTQVIDCTTRYFMLNTVELTTFEKQLESNFFEGLAPALTSLIIDDADNIIGYVTKEGPLLSANEFDSHLIPRDFFRILKNRIKESGMFFL